MQLNKIIYLMILMTGMAFAQQPPVSGGSSITNAPQISASGSITAGTSVSGPQVKATGSGAGDMTLTQGQKQNIPANSVSVAAPVTVSTPYSYVMGGSPVSGVLNGTLSTAAVFGNCTLSSGGVSTCSTITSGGNYYQTPPCSIVGNGTGATCSFTMSNSTYGSITAVSVGAAGTGYSGTVQPSALQMSTGTMAPLSCAILDTAICSSSVDGNGNPNFLTAGAGAVINVNGGTTSLTYFVAGVYQVINANLSVTAATPAGETENFIFAKLDIINANPVNADLAVSSCVPIVAWVVPASCGTASGSNPQAWYDLSTNVMKFCTGTCGTPANFVATPAILLGVAALSLTPTVDLVAAMPYRTNPQKQFDVYGDASSGALALTSGTTTQDGQYQYSGCMISGSTTLKHSVSSAALNSSGLFLLCQTPFLMVGGSATINVSGLGRAGATGAAGICTNVAGVGGQLGGAGSGSGGASATNAGCTGGSRPALSGAGTNTGGGAGGAIAGAATAGASVSVGFVGSGVIPFGHVPLDYVNCVGAGGAAGAGIAAGGTGGSGGNGGGCAEVKAPSANIASGSTINANGANGSAGTTSTSSGGCGGGGGGGTAVLIVGFSVNVLTGVSATGGSGNTTCSGLTPASGNGAAGGTGTVQYVRIT